MPYKRKKGTSGFKSYCSKQLRAIKSAKTAGTRSRSAKRWQQCLADRGIKKWGQIQKI